MFRQFAVTISAAMVISAINALTLSPALCSIFLKPESPIGIMKHITGTINRIADGYSAIVGRLVKVAVLSLIIVAALGFATYLLFIKTPSGFLPEEDKGYLIVIFNLPAGASLNRTDAAAKKAEAIVNKDPAVAAAITVLGLDFLGGGSSSSAGVMFVRLKPYDQRKSANMHASAVARRLFGALSQITDGFFSLSIHRRYQALARPEGLNISSKDWKARSLRQWLRPCEV